MQELERGTVEGGEEITRGESGAERGRGREGRFGGEKGARRREKETASARKGRELSLLPHPTAGNLRKAHPREVAARR